ncbi:A disintegrin and metalloproteinase with thrombospondin motifs 7-like [Linepithema humile]|uniref:A disintegrin and metalloproteinase with thrombospondin motifs 7-like n=1 Tax=Linepithema humile TaxID=83485 RepID=UPI00351F3F53
MLLILKFVLIIILNVTYESITQDSEILLLPALNPTGMNEIPLTLKVFGKLIQLNLRRDDQTVLPASNVWKYNAKSIAENFLQSKASISCFYLHEDHVSFAAINFCQGNGLEGLVFVENVTLEIRPLRNDFALPSIIDDFCVKEQINVSFGKFHLIKTSVLSFNGLNLNHWNNFKPKRRRVRSTQEKITIELAVFFDEAAYRTFMPLLDNNKEKIRYMILAYVNRIQAIFHHSSLGVSVDISLKYLEIMENQPMNLPVNSDYKKLLNSFCKYARLYNPVHDNDPLHWDFSLCLTGIDLYKYLKNTLTKSYTILGRSHLNGICNREVSCAITEFRATSEIISSIIKESASVAVHEIAHALGLTHDSKNSTDIYAREYIMAAYTSNQSQISWSEHSHKEMRWLLWSEDITHLSYSCLRDHVRSEDDTYVFESWSYHNLPGREWTAKAQCELFLRDEDANVVTLHDICQNLQCETPHKNIYYFTGPALAGTHCALGKECRREECVPVIEPPYIFKYCEDDNWSEWKEDTCKSSCLEESKGALVKRRFCKHKTHKTADCIGPYYDVNLCDDSSLCNERRKTIAEFTTMKCTEFSRTIFELETKPGWQASHEVDKPWIACTIHCVQKKHPIYYTLNLRFKMLDYGINPYFPDGTWCHKENDEDYYCRQHYCLPQSYSFEEQ